MNINSCGVSFNGLYKYNGSVNKSSGKEHYNKVVHHIYNSTYHPYEDESPEDIKKELDRTYFGRTYRLYEDQRWEGDYYQMNRIKVGETIKRADEEKYLKEGYSKDPQGIYLKKDDFYAAYDNYEYGVMDYDELSPERVEEIAEKYEEE